MFTYKYKRPLREQTNRRSRKQRCIYFQAFIKAFHNSYRFIKELKMKQRLTILLFATMFALPCGALAAPESFAPIVEKANPAVVYIEVTQERQVQSPISLFDLSPWGRGQKQYQEPQTEVVRGSGSGAIIDAENGYVLTAAHVIEDVDAAVVHLPDGRNFDVIDFLYDSQTDVGLVQIDFGDQKILSLFYSFLVFSITYDDGHLRQNLTGFNLVFSP